MSFVGIVEDCSDKSLVGKRVSGEINIGCGVCTYCVEGLKNHCPDRSVLGILNKDGAFAEFLTLPISNLHLIPNSVSDERAVFIEPLAAVFEIIEQVHIEHGDKVCILGDGRMGLLAGQVLSLTGCTLTVVGRHKEKLAIVEKRGITTKLTADTIEREFDFVVECTGSHTGFENALKIVKPRGTIVLKTTVAKRKTINLNPVVIDETTIVGSRCGPFVTAIKALEEKSVNLESLMDKTFALEDGLDAIEYAFKKEVLKVLIKV